MLLRSPRGLAQRRYIEYGLCAGTLPRQPAGCSPVLNALWKGQPHGLPKLQSVTNRDGGDDVLDLATAHQKTVTVVTL